MRRLVAASLTAVALALGASAAAITPVPAPVPIPYPFVNRDALVHLYEPLLNRSKEVTASSVTVEGERLHVTGTNAAGAAVADFYLPIKRGKIHDAKESAQKLMAAARGGKALPAPEVDHLFDLIDPQAK